MSEKEYSPSDIENILKEEKKVVLASGFTATQAEIEWAKEALKEHPDDFDCIEDVITFARSYEEAERGEGTVFWYD